MATEKSTNFTLINIVLIVVFLILLCASFWLGTKHQLNNNDIVNTEVLTETNTEVERKLNSSDLDYRNKNCELLGDAYTQNDLKDGILYGDNASLDNQKALYSEKLGTCIIKRKVITADNYLSYEVIDIVNGDIFYECGGARGEDSCNLVERTDKFEEQL